MKAIPEARAKLAARLPSTIEILRGSLLHRRIRHRSGCAVCARGPGHLVRVLTISYPGGRTRQIGLSAEQKPLVQQWLRNYRKLKQNLGAHLRVEPATAAPGEESMSCNAQPQLSFADFELQNQ